MAAKKRSLWNLSEHFEGDKVVWIIALMLILMSIVCIFSSTSRLVDANADRVDFFKHQLIIVAVGLGLMIICYSIKSINFFRTVSKWCFPLSFALLLMLDAHVSIGSVITTPNINGANRILQIMGFQLHVFEVVKVAMVMYLAWAMDAHKKKELKGNFSDKVKKILYVYAPFLITFVMILPGSNSSAIFIGAIMFVTILLGGGNMKDMLILAAAGISALLLCFGIYKISDGKMFGRIGTAISRVFDDDDNEAKFLAARKGSKDYYDALDAIRQPISARIAIKEGGLFGKGPGQSTQRYVVPDMPEDYMYSFIIEEYGLLGGILVIFLYVSLLARGAIIARNCGKDMFAKLAVAGLCILITSQAFLHMFVNADIGIMTGQTLPLISHGKSAFLCFSIAFGIILSFSRIASRRIDAETNGAVPLVDLEEVEVKPAEKKVRDTEDILDDLEMFETEGISQDIEDYE